MSNHQQMDAVSLPLFRYRTGLIGLFQAFLVLFSLTSAWLLRFEFTLPNHRLLLSAAIVLMTVRLIPIAYFGLLHGWWRYVGVTDAFAVAKAVACGSILFWVLTHFVIRQVSIPRSVIILEAILTTMLLIGVRVFSRMLAEWAGQESVTAKRVLLVGAGTAARIILREINRQDSGFVAVGCLDDNASKRGIRIEGIPVLGLVDDLPTIVRVRSIDEVLIAVPSPTGPQMRRFLEICNKANVNFRIVPALKDIIAGQISISQLREVSVEDLLGRVPARIDLRDVRQQIAGRTILVTGAAGSIGSEVCRQLLDCDPRHLICLDQGETALFFKQLELSRHRNSSKILFCVADVNDEERIQSLLQRHRPDIIFHVAAYKHVPLMEINVQEAVENNVFALVKLLDLAEAAGCESFVFISSDKAVNPSSVMGTTKRIGELILAARPSHGMRGVAVRFGNVLGSSGSVVPVLLDQLRNNQPLTVTHPNIRRYFMTTHEAVALVLQAFAIGAHGDILVLDMGESICIADLARSLIRLSGKREQDAPIQFTGLRPGEKLQEELFYEDEEVLATSCEKIRKVRSNVHSWQALQQHLVELRASMSIDGAAPIRAKMKEIVPQFAQDSAADQSESLGDFDAPVLQRTAGNGV
jgi:FlaA1/EpsC-like NDP-sugar epimerase